MVVPSKFLSWNYRGGLSFFRKQNLLRFLGRKNGLCCMGLCETKKEDIDSFLIQRLWAHSEFKFHYIPSKDLSAGLCLVWNIALIKNYLAFNGSRWIMLSFHWDSVLVRIILVYAPNFTSGKCALLGRIFPLVVF